MKSFPLFSILCLAVIFAGCSQYNVVPDRLEDQVNHTLKFEQIRENPDAYKGKLVVVGGEVLSIDRRQDKTTIEVLQLPLTDDFIPGERRTATQGRFVAVSKGKDPLDPAVLEKGDSISLVGEILGRTMIQVGEDEKNAPLFGIKDLTIWEESRYLGHPSYGYGRGYGGYAGFRPYGYPYY